MSDRAAGGEGAPHPTRACPACAARAWRSVLSATHLPVLANALAADRERALAAPTGDLELARCEHCGLLHNLAFDAARVAYDPGYDNSLHFSPTFRAYAAELAGRLVETYDLRAKHVVEIGSGSGDFLAQLCDLGENTGLGFDPSFDPARADRTSSAAVTVRPEPFPADGPVDADLVTCQHVLEHLPEPRAVLADVRRATLESGGSTVLYLEVPNAAYMLDRHAVWDLVYEHCSYFTDRTLRWLLESVGFEVLDHGTSFGDQYLWLEARPVVDPPRSEPRGVGAEAVADFAAAFRSTIASWDRRVREMQGDGPVVVWGAGSKGVSFLNLVPAADGISHVVDVNPRKQGRYVPGSGHEVIGPDALAALRPAYVVLMNPLYEDEVRATVVDDLGLDAPVVPVADADQ